MNKAQGNVGEAAALLYFTKQGFIVSKPMFENTPYDFIVDDGTTLQKVQVKTTSYKKPSGNYAAELRTKGGNTSWNGVVKVITKDSCDLLYIHCGDFSQYLIPVERIDGQVTVTLGKDYAEYRVQ